MKSRLSFVLAVFVVTVVVMAVQKPMFMAYYASLVSDVSWGEWLEVIWRGLALDIAVAGYVTAQPLILTMVLLLVRLQERLWRGVLVGYFVVVAVFTAWVFAVDIALYEHWGFRLDATILIYLADPKEAMASVDFWLGVRQTLFFVGYAAAMIWLYCRVVQLFDLRPMTWLHALSWCAVFLLLAGCDFVAMRGGLGASVANVSKVYFSPNMFLNHAATNPVFSFLSTLGKNTDYASAYPFYEEEERAARFEQIRGNRTDGAAENPLADSGRGAAMRVSPVSPVPSVSSVSPVSPVPPVSSVPPVPPVMNGGGATSLVADGGHTIHASSKPVLRMERPNVVVILLESFSRAIMEEAIDGQAVMPYMQKLKNEGVWFENFFSNSFRTDRGEVAVLSGFPSQTHLSIMKLPAKSRNLPSIARSLGEVGYTTHFTYGGDLNFTNQASYMYATGWTELTWQKDLHFDTPPADWGYDDALMCSYFAEQVIALSDSQTPFLAGFLTLSSHRPFDVPYSKFESPLLNAMAFTDECVGRMIEQLKASPAWDDLVVVLVADHGYPYPATLPHNAPDRHRIPMLWLGGAVVEPRVVMDYASQIDLCATLLAQLGVSHADFDYSKDLFAPTPPPKFAYYTFNEGFGVVGASGSAIWDAATGAATGATSVGADSVLLEIGKTMLQTTYVDIGRR